MIQFEWWLGQIFVAHLHCLWMGNVFCSLIIYLVIYSSQVWVKIRLMIKSHFRRPPSLSHGENSTTQGHCRSGIGRGFQWISSILSNLKFWKKIMWKIISFMKKYLDCPKSHLNCPRYCDESNFHHRRIIKIIIGMSSS